MGDLPGHPFHGNQYGAGLSDKDRGALARGDLKGMSDEGLISLHSGRQDVRSAVEQGWSAKTIASAIREQKTIPASGRIGSSVQAAHDAVVHPAAEHLAGAYRGRAYEGHGGTATPQEGDAVRVMGRVGGGGKSGTVVMTAPSGSFHTVKFKDGSTASYHSSDLKVKDQSGGRF